MSINPIPKFADINNSIRMARKFIFSQNIHSLPINIKEIYENNGWKLFTTKEAISKLLKGKKINNGSDPFKINNSNKCYAKTYLKNGIYITIYDNNYSKGMIQWTLAHEIAHIVLGHLSKYDKTELSRNGLSNTEYTVLEKEADFFARELLAPTFLLEFCELSQNEVAIEKLCGVSKKASKNIKNNILKHIHKNIHIESKEFIYRQFFHFITRKEYHNLVFGTACTKCHSFFIPSNKYCNICGNDKYSYFKGIFYSEFLEFRSDSRITYCYKCNNHQFSNNTHFCRICGSSLINGCLNYYDDTCGALFYDNSRYCKHCGHNTSFLNDTLNSWNIVKNNLINENILFNEIKEDFDYDYFRDWDYFVNLFNKNNDTIELFLNLKNSKCRVINDKLYIYVSTNKNLNYLNTAYNKNIIVTRLKKNLNLSINHITITIDNNT